MKDRIPSAISRRREELERLCEENPQTIKAEKVAKYYGIDVDTLRTSIDQGKCAFGFGLNNGSGRNRYAVISTLAFYNFEIGGKGQ